MGSWSSVIREACQVLSFDAVDLLCVGLPQACRWPARSGCRDPGSRRAADRPATAAALRRIVGVMSSAHALLRERQRLDVARRFLQLRPRVAIIGAGVNALALAASDAPRPQRLALGLSVGLTVVGFFVEAAVLARRPLGLAWLRVSLAATVLALAAAAALSGGITSPLLPLLFAPVVVAFAAFARARESFAVFALAAALVLLLALAPPVFPAPRAPWGAVMTANSALVALVLLGLGVTGLVDAHDRVSRVLERMRAEVVVDATRRAGSLERLGAEVAHDVKNPLTAARALAQLVERGAAGKDRERLAVVVGEIDRALARLHAYLTFAKPIGGLVLESHDLRALAEDVASTLEARAAEADVSVHVRGPALSWPVDAPRLKDALLNLALNAIAATPPGGALHFSVERSDQAARILVEDDGAGMSAEALEQLGEPFESSSGTGLGVSIARAIVAQHGGTLRFESTLGLGTRAIVDLG